MNLFKRCMIILLLFISYTCICAISYANAVSSDLAESVFRLHIIANSDTKEDHLDDFQKIARETIVSQGYDYDVSLEVGKFDFPTKVYGDISLPSGMYDALRIRIR